MEPGLACSLPMSVAMLAPMSTLQSMLRYFDTWGGGEDNEGRGVGNVLWGENLADHGLLSPPVPARE